MLYDFGYLAYIGSLGCFCVMWMSFGLAIMSGPQQRLAEMAWLLHRLAVRHGVDGRTGLDLQVGAIRLERPDDVLVGDGVYVSWQIIVYVCIYRAIKNQPEEELENADLQRDAGVRDASPRMIT